MGAVFAKTTKGQNEITGKAGGLTPRVRRVLIFADGKRTVDEMREMLRSDDLQHTLGILEEEGYIELISDHAPNKIETQAAQATRSITAFNPLPESTDPPATVTQFHAQHPENLCRLTRHDCLARS